MSFNSHQKLRGAPTAPPNPAKGYGGGRLLSTKVLGAFVGDALECSQRLQRRVRDALADLGDVARLRDTRHCNVSLQVQFEILRHCANTSLVYFLRTMGVAATRDAAALHDQLISDAFHRIVGTGAASPAVRNRAARQARLPVKMGGCGLTEQTSIAEAACVGSWALIWRPMQQLAPQLFGGVDLDAAPEPVFGELRQAHASLMEAHARVSPAIFARHCLGEACACKRYKFGHWPNEERKFKKRNPFKISGTRKNSFLYESPCNGEYIHLVMSELHEDTTHIGARMVRTMMVSEKSEVMRWYAQLTGKLWPPRCVCFQTARSDQHGVPQVAPDGSLLFVPMCVDIEVTFLEACREWRRLNPKEPKANPTANTDQVEPESGGESASDYESC